MSGAREALGAGPVEVDRQDGGAGELEFRVGGGIDET